uniref:Uncharacterized protein n=1 Tax=Heliothis virescens TaxID=7102 RepID=A0A2A4JJK1_HELVI
MRGLGGLVGAAGRGALRLAGGAAVLERRAGRAGGCRGCSCARRAARAARARCAAVGGGRRPARAPHGAAGQRTRACCRGRAAPPTERRLPSLRSPTLAQHKDDKEQVLQEKDCAALPVIYDGVPQTRTGRRCSRARGVVPTCFGAYLETRATRRHRPPLRIWPCRTHDAHARTPAAVVRGAGGGGGAAGISRVEQQVGHLRDHVCRVPVGRAAARCAARARLVSLVENACDAPQTTWRALRPPRREPAQYRWLGRPAGHRRGDRAMEDPDCVSLMRACCAWRAWWTAKRALLLHAANLYFLDSLRARQAGRDGVRSTMQNAANVTRTATSQAGQYVKEERGGLPSTGRPPGASTRRESAEGPVGVLHGTITSSMSSERQPSVTGIYVRLQAVVVTGSAPSCALRQLLLERIAPHAQSSPQQAPYSCRRQLVHVLRPGSFELEDNHLVVRPRAAARARSTPPQAHGQVLVQKSRPLTRSIRAYSLPASAAAAYVVHAQVVGGRSAARSPPRHVAGTAAPRWPAHHGQACTAAHWSRFSCPTWLVPQRTLLQHAHSPAGAIQLLEPQLAVCVARYVARCGRARPGCARRAPMRDVLRASRYAPTCGTRPRSERIVVDDGKGAQSFFLKNLFLSSLCCASIVSAARQAPLGVARSSSSDKHAVDPSSLRFYAALASTSLFCPLGCPGRLRLLSAPGAARRRLSRSMSNESALPCADGVVLLRAAVPSAPDPDEALAQAPAADLQPLRVHHHAPALCPSPNRYTNEPTTQREPASASELLPCPHYKSRLRVRPLCVTTCDWCKALPLCLRRSELTALIDIVSSVAVNLASLLQFVTAL